MYRTIRLLFVLVLLVCGPLAPLPARAVLERLRRRAPRPDPHALHAEGQLVDERTGETAPLVEGLSSVTGVLAASDGAIYVVEFSEDMLGDPAPPGRLLRVDAPGADPEVVAGGLISPVGIERDARTGDLYVAEIFTGRIIRVTGA